MQRILFFLSVVLTAQLSIAQNVGIGTTTPNTSAQLDVTSSTKGLLLPRMTTSQRFAISNPANGLIVYDTDFKELFHHNGTAWQTLLNSRVWTPSPTRRCVYNFSDSIGIGTSTPDARLEVIGNVKTSARIDAGGVVEAAGLSSTGGLYVSNTSLFGGALAASTTGLFQGLLTSNTGIVINDPLAELTLKNASVEKGFVQLSGDNLRLGTFSTNNTGKFVVRTNGNDHFTIDASGNGGFGMDPSGLGAKFAVFGKTRAIANGGDAFQSTGNAAIDGKLTVNRALEAIHIEGNDPAINFFEGATQRGYLWMVDNNMNIGTSQANSQINLVTEKLTTNGDMVVESGRLTASNTGSAYNLLPFAYGRVSAAGNKAGGTTNFTSVTKLGAGGYQLNIANLNSSSVIMATCRGFGVAWTRILVGDLEVWTYNPATEEYQDTDFHFVIFNP